MRMQNFRLNEIENGLARRWWFGVDLYVMKCSMFYMKTVGPVFIPQYGGGYGWANPGWHGGIIVGPIVPYIGCDVTMVGCNSIQ